MSPVRILLISTSTLLVANLVSIAAAPVAPPTLQLVQVLYRHGARTPISTYPTDPNEGAWPEGPGQLTNEGKRNQRLLGQWLRRRYDGFLPTNYHMNYTVVRSTDVDRTLMSAQANLAGLYPPKGGDVWVEDLAWQPIPVHTVPQDQDLLLKSYDNCRVYLEQRKLVDESDNMTAYNNQHAALYQYLQENSGKPITCVKDVSYLYDALLIEYRANLTTPSWATAPLPNSGSQTPVFPDLMSPVNDLEFGLFGVTQLQRRLGGGPLLQEMIQHMNSSVESTLEPANRRMFVYSAHDTTVSSFLTTLELYNNRAPPLASCVLVELHSSGTDEYSVQIWYKNGTAVDTPYQLTLPGCTADCPLKQFVELTKDVTPEDVVKECNSS